MLLRLFKKLNPERNFATRAVIYVIGAGGLIHLTSLLVLAIIKQDTHYFNPFYTVDIDQIWPATRRNPFLYIVGWLGFFGLIYIMYRLLNRQRKT